MKKALKTFLVCFSMLFIFSVYANAEKKVTFGTVSWPPFYGEDLKNQGFMTEITKNAFEKAGWEYQVNFMNWNRAVALAKQVTDSPKANIFNLLKDRVDFIIGEKHVTLNLINQHFSSQAQLIKPLSPPLENRPLFNAVSKKSPHAQEIVNAFNKGLEMIKQDGTYYKIMNEHGF